MGAWLGMVKFIAPWSKCWLGDGANGIVLPTLMGIMIIVPSIPHPRRGEGKNRERRRGSPLGQLGMIDYMGLFLTNILKHIGSVYGCVWEHARDDYWLSTSWTNRKQSMGPSQITIPPSKVMSCLCTCFVCLYIRDTPQICHASFLCKRGLSDETFPNLLMLFS